MTERDYELLHRFIDGEMTPAEQQEFERSLAQNSELDGMRRELEDMGHMLRSHITNELEEVDFTHFMSGIEAQLGAAVATNEPVQVVPPTTVRQDATSQGGLGGWLSRFWVPTLIGSAVAAAILLFAVNRPEQSGVGPSGPQLVVVDSVKIEGTQTVLVMEPVDKDDATVIWLIDGEKENQEPIDGEDPI